MAMRERKYQTIPSGSKGREERDRHITKAIVEVS
jgi:hypothetical protein